MTEKTFNTRCGDIHYWLTEEHNEDMVALVFLPGLMADHRLFERQIEYLSENFRCLVWDPPQHGQSWPFKERFDLSDKAEWLDQILCEEGIRYPIIVGQSMGGYVGQVYAQLFPKKLAGFIAIDSAPLQKSYMTLSERWLLKRRSLFYKLYPWKVLLKSGTIKAAKSKYGRELMREMMMAYDGDKERYVQVAGHGFWMLSNAIRANMPYIIKCPALLICGEEDRVGYYLRYNKAWNKRTGIKLEWIEGAGHLSNTDDPEGVNYLIESLAEKAAEEIRENKGVLMRLPRRNR